MLQDDVSCRNSSFFLDCKENDLSPKVVSRMEQTSSEVLD
jgi:hypothetical protein